VAWGSKITARLRKWVEVNPVAGCLVAAALVLAALAVVLRIWNLETSYTQETTGPPTTTPTVTVTPAVTVTPKVVVRPKPKTGPPVTATPTLTVTPTITATPILAPSAVATFTDTVSKGTGSDTLELGILSFAAFLALMAAFFKRIASITGPGGIVFTLNPVQRKKASSAVAGRLRASAEKAATRQPPPADQGEQLLQPETARLATSTEHTPDDVVEATSETAQQAGQATVLTAQYAETLLRLARTAPEEFGVVASAWGIPAAEQLTMLAGEIPDSLWDQLAGRALEEVNRSPSTS
jgi:hypothetical protein